MARTPSKMIELGKKVPEFKLLDTADNKIKFSNDLFKNKGVLIMFICNHYKNDICFIAISSNDVNNYPEDSPELMNKLAKNKGFKFPYLYDESQKIAKLFDAACTPDFFLYNSKKQLIYRGQLDGSRPGNDIPVTGIDIRNALDCLIRGIKNLEIQKPSIGCNIKWK